MIIKKIAKIKLDRGLEPQRVQKTFKESELVYSIDKERMFIGDGETKGGILVSNRNYVVNSIDGNFNLPSTSFYGDIINDRVTNNTYIIGYGPDGTSLSAILINNGTCVSKIKKDLDDILNTIIPLTGCLIQPCENPPPESLKWVQQPFNVIAKMDQTVSFTASAVGDGDITYQWYVSKSPYELIENADDAVYMINSVKKADEGYYKCVATSSLTGPLTSVAGKLSVAVPAPSFVSDIYTLEGGYGANTYTFLYMSSAFFDPSIKSSILQIVDSSRIKEITIPNTSGSGPATITIPYINGHARINWRNRFIINSDGSISTSLGTTNQTKPHPYLVKVFDQIIDVYTPSTSTRSLILLSNGDLMDLNIDSTGKVDNVPFLVSNNIKKFIQKSKSHSMLCTVVDNDGNVIIYDSGKLYVLTGLKETDIIAIGASNENGWLVIKKADNKNIYQILPTTNKNSINPNWLDITLSNKIPTYELKDPDEVYLDVKCHETNRCLLTNKGIYDKSFHKTPFLLGKSIPPHTSYSFKIYGIDNKFYTIDGKLDNFYTPLKDYLDKIKFGTS